MLDNKTVHDKFFRQKPDGNSLRDIVLDGIELIVLKIIIDRIEIPTKT